MEDKKEHVSVLCFCSRQFWFVNQILVLRLVVDVLHRVSHHSQHVFVGDDMLKKNSSLLATISSRFKLTFKMFFTFVAVKFDLAAFSSNCFSISSSRFSKTLLSSKSISFFCLFGLSDMTISMPSEESSSSLSTRSPSLSSL